MNFDVKPYCERLAKAAPERFCITHDVEFGGELGDRDGSGLLLDCRSPVIAWAFIGPLADELGVRPSDLLDAKARIYWKDDAREAGLLEATFAAVCEKLESAQP